MLNISKSCFCFLSLLSSLWLSKAQISYTNGFIDPKNPVVQTQYGPVRGSRYTLLNNLVGQQPGITYVQFIGIPYASPPTGANRFRPPMAPSIWSHERDCTESKRVMCPQVYQRFRTSTAIPEDEDCLHLNIYVPVESIPVTLPVLVYIHGGEFEYGGKDLYRPDFLLQAGGGRNSHFIVVTINYRLGILGFLSTDDFNCPGNNGIRDQVMALEWVHKNIGKFGGNPSNITIMGHDAGGVSVSFHLLNPEANQYFTNAISISGTIFSPWAIQDNPLAQARDFAYKFTCGYRQDQIVECLRYQDRYQLMAANAERDWNQNRRPFWFRPVVDRNVSGSALLKDFPKILYESGKFNAKPYLVIAMANEGSLEYYLQAGHMPKTKDIQRQISFLIRPYLQYYTNEQIIAAAFEYRYFSNITQRSLNVASGQNLFGPNANPALINSQYTLNNQINQNGYSPFLPDIGSGNLGYTQKDLDTLFSQMLGDFLYLGPIDQAAKFHSYKTPTMMLIFDYVGQKSFGLLQNGLQQQVNIDTFQATHFNDLFYLMPNEYDSEPLRSTDLNAARSYTKFISEFVLYGIKQNNGQYALYQSSAPSYNILDRNGYQIQQRRTLSSDQGFRTSYSDFSMFICNLQEVAKIFPPYFPQQEYKSYQQATWSLVAVLIFFILLALILVIVLIVKKRREHNQHKQHEQVTIKSRFDGRLSD